MGNLLALSGVSGEGTVIWSHGLELIALEWPHSHVWCLALAFNCGSKG